MAKKKTNDEFVLFDLKVETIATNKPFVCSHKRGDSFILSGENLTFKKNQKFSIYSLSALIPLLPAKQRILHPNDWMSTDTDIACPDPNCGAIFRISRIAKRTFKHSETTIVPLNN